MCIRDRYQRRVHGIMDKQEEVKIVKKSFIMKQDNIQDVYDLESKEIGSGNYGVVKKLVHKMTKQERAVKIIPKSKIKDCLLYTSPSPRDLSTSRMPSSA
eukprot:TRINITY_DN61646_c0_g1_i1.p3 TRINITY_DN61646_c0_g1~~TRINITY_DN61646_c0_g1_i1.p3  ORF type:complete len:100 (-),score=30.51 TRINITY_DN61646_c0_g1_i1:110-409(-)